MFWAIARSKRISTQEMNDRSQFKNLNATSPSKAQTPASAWQLNNRDKSTGMRDKQHDSVAPDDEVNQMALDEDKATSIPSGRTMNHHQRMTDATNRKLQATLQTDRK